MAKYQQPPATKHSFARLQFLIISGIHYPKPSTSRFWISKPSCFPMSLITELSFFTTSPESHECVILSKRATTSGPEDSGFKLLQGSPSRNLRDRRLLRVRVQGLRSKALGFGVGGFKSLFPGCIGTTRKQIKQYEPYSWRHLQTG